MTRINSAIHPTELHNKHLVAEYREIGRVSTLFANRIEKSKQFDDIPTEFTLGPGHVKFFLNKGKFLENRFNSLKQEMIKRGFKANLKFRNSWIENNRLDMYNDYTPTEKERQLLKDRIRQRMPKTLVIMEK